MKIVILAGGRGTRLAEETEVKPKPMVEIGGRPILWHIMKHYAYYGFDEFFIALGYRGNIIKRYFLDYFSLSRNMTVHLGNGQVEFHDRDSEDWTVHLIDTGLNTNTGGRIKRLKEWLTGDTFMVTYGDGVANIDLAALCAFHQSHGHMATVTAVRPPARFGGLEFAGDLVARFTEKPQAGEGWINGGFFVCEPGILDYIPDDDTSFEAHTLEQVAAEGELIAYRHYDFWQCMDTIRDVRFLESLWQKGNSPWKVWTA